MGFVGLSLPSYLALYSLCVFLPCESTPSAVSLMPPSIPSNFTVLLCGAGPGLYFDFATFNFHVPTRLSAAIAVTVNNTSTATNAMQITGNLILILISWVVVLFARMILAQGVRINFLSHFENWTNPAADCTDNADE